MGRRGRRCEGAVDRRGSGVCCTDVGETVLAGNECAHDGESHDAVANESDKEEEDEVEQIAQHLADHDEVRTETPHHRAELQETDDPEEVQERVEVEDAENETGSRGRT